MGIESVYTGHTYFPVVNSVGQIVWWEPKNIEYHKHQPTSQEYKLSEKADLLPPTHTPDPSKIIDIKV